MWTPYRPLSSTIFDQVYGGYQQRPTSISLNTQWLPVNDCSSTDRWNPSHMHSRKLKTRTFFDSAARREQQQTKAITPPSSDYTDAYLSAFAPKPIIPTRRIYRLTAPVFANFAPIRTLSSTNNSIKTSRTRFNTINSLHTSNSFDSTKPSFPSSSSTYLSSLIPDISIKSEAPVHSFPRPSSFTIPITIRSDLPAENVNKPILSSPSQSPSLLPTIPTSPSIIKTA